MSCSNQDSTSSHEVEIIKPSKKLRFKCTTCECEFKVAKHYCELEQTGLTEYTYTHSCPECNTLCYEKS